MALWELLAELLHVYAATDNLVSPCTFQAAPFIKLLLPEQFL